MTSFRAFLFRYVPPSCLYMFGMCVVWLEYKMGDWLVLCFSESSAVERKGPSWDVEAFTAHTESGASPGPGAWAAHHRTEKQTLPESPLCKKKEKIKRGGGEEYPVEWKHKCTIQHPYLQTNRKYKHYRIWNQVKTPGRAKFRYCLCYTYILQQNRSSLKNKQKITQTDQIIDWFPNDELKLIVTLFD